MDKQEAKLILQSYRSNGRDANDPAFAEALVMAQNDPELREWFAQEQARDGAICNRLKDSPIPTDLKNAILSGLRTEANIVRPESTWWRSPALAWAAVIAIIFVAAFLIQEKHPGTGQLALADYRITMRSNLETLNGFDLPKPEPVEIKTWLREQGVFGDVTIPDKLTDKQSMGCKLFKYKDAQSALICFQLPNMEMVHLFVINKSTFSESAAGDAADFTKCGDWDTCTWEQGENLYLLLGKVGNTTLKTLASR